MRADAAPSMQRNKRWIYHVRYRLGVLTVTRSNEVNYSDGLVSALAAESSAVGVEVTSSFSSAFSRAASAL